MLALAAAVTMFVIYSATLQDSLPAPVRRATITLPADRTMPTDFTRGAPFALSPDGSLAVYSGIEGGRHQLYARRLDAFDSTPIDGTEGATNPFFSPDGDWIGFLADDWLKKVPAGGGVAQPICEVGPRLLGATWTTAGTILYSPDIATGLHEVSAGGGDGVAITSPDRSLGIVSHTFPRAIPGTDKVVFTVQHSEGFDTAILSLADRTWNIVIENSIVASYAASGHLVYLTDMADELRAVRFDLSGQRTEGDHVAVTQGGWFDLSPDGTLAYMPRSSFILAGAGSGDLVWVDRDGSETLVLGGEDISGRPVLSPGEERVAVEVGSSALDLYVLDLSTGGRSRVSGRRRTPPTW